jgi:cytochrome c
MKETAFFTTILTLASFASGLDLSCKKSEMKILIFSKTAGYRHESIVAGRQALLKLAPEKGFRADTTENAENFNEAFLKDYDAIVFLCTTGEVLNESQQEAMRGFIQAGGGFVGIHSAADTEYDWAWYGQLVGAYFNGHPGNPNVREAVMTVTDQKHEATKMLPTIWKCKKIFSE